MYRGAGAFSGKYKKENEWCEFDPTDAKKYIILILTLILINIYVASIAIAIVIQSMYKTDFIMSILISTVISIPIMVIFGYKIWKIMNKKLTYFKDSYHIELKLDKNKIKKIITAIKCNLNKLKIQYDPFGEVGEEDYLFIIFNRIDNLHSIIEITGTVKKGIDISIYTADFDNKEDAIKIRDIIWDEKRNSPNI